MGVIYQNPQIWGEMAPSVHIDCIQKKLYEKMIWNSLYCTHENWNKLIYTIQYNIFLALVMHLSLFWSSKLMITSPIYEKLQKRPFLSWCLYPHCLWCIQLALKSTVFVWFEPFAPTCANNGYIYMKEDFFPVLGV